jgi:adenine-specific DNA glycosylase
LRKAGFTKLNMLDNNIKRKIRKQVLGWSITNLGHFPWREKDICPYEIFVTEMLLKRTTAKAASYGF